MKLRKHLSFFALMLVTGIVSNLHAQDKPIIYLDPEIEPHYPGGTAAFSKFIQKNLKYPEVAALVGLTGKVCVSFTVTKKGNLKDITPAKCLGAGCEAEAVRVLAMSPKWVPGTMGGKPVDIQYLLPITFSLSEKRTKTTFKSLAVSKYGFVFFINGKIYPLHDAQVIIGDSFDPKLIETVEKFDNPKYKNPDKKGVYLIVLRRA